jgi:hypothetical protein
MQQQTYPAVEHVIVDGASSAKEIRASAEMPGRGVRIPAARLGPFPTVPGQTEA